MSNGSTTNGCHQTQQIIQDIPMDFHANNQQQQPNIHPGCISSTGRNGRPATTSGVVPSDPHQLQQQQPQQLFQMWGNTIPAGGSNGIHSTGGGVTNSISGGLSSVSLGGNLASTPTANTVPAVHHPHSNDVLPHILSQVDEAFFLLP